MTPTKRGKVIPIGLLLAAALVFAGNRGGLAVLQAILAPIARVVDVRPDVDVNSLSPAYKSLYTSLGAVSSGDRDTLGKFYAGFARAVAADPADEPVLRQTEDVRRAHRAALLFLWRGMAGNQPDKYAGLSDGLSGVLSEALGSGDVPLNPTIRKATEECFTKVSSLCLTARP